jgi:hypothetical protein
MPNGEGLDYRIFGAHRLCAPCDGTILANLFKPFDILSGLNPEDSYC